MRKSGLDDNDEPFISVLMIMTNLFSVLMINALKPAFLFSLIRRHPMTPPQTKTLRNSELTVPKEKRSFLIYPANGLVPCTLEETEDSISLLFETQGLEPSEAILGKPKWEQIRFLVNCASLAALDTEYDFPLSLDNQLIDINLMPGILIRDAKNPANESFLQRYKALAGSILLPKYKYEDYIRGGKDLYKKNKLLSEIAQLEETEEIQDRLLKEYRRMMWETSTTKKLVPKMNVWLSRIAIPLLAMTLLAAAFFGGRLLLIEIPLRDSIITANTAYINRDPLTVQRTLRPYTIDRLPVETRYFLSRSYVSTEALTDGQREIILLTLAPITNPMLFDYWILLGRLYFEEAIDIAQRLGDDELLLYAFLKQEAFVRSDLSIPGEERVQLLTELERNIERLNRERDDAVREVLESP